MKTLILLFVVFVLIAVAVTRIKKKQGSDGPEHYKKKPLTQVEQVAYHRLRQALPNHIVLSQVSLYQLVGVKKGEGSQTAKNRISQKCADFVICTPSFEVTAVIELDDASHSSENAKKRDREKNNALEKAGHRIIRWTVKEMPSIEDITTMFIAEKPHPMHSP